MNQLIEFPVRQEPLVTVTAAVSPTGTYTVECLDEVAIASDLERALRKLELRLRLRVLDWQDGYPEDDPTFEQVAEAAEAGMLLILLRLHAPEPELRADPFELLTGGVAS